MSWRETTQNWGLSGMEGEQEVLAVRAGSILEITLSSETWERHISWVPGPGFGIQEGPECRITNLQSSFYVPGCLLSTLHKSDHVSLQKPCKVWKNCRSHFTEEQTETQDGERDFS